MHVFKNRHVNLRHFWPRHIMGFTSPYSSFTALTASRSAQTPSPNPRPCVPGVATKEEEQAVSEVLMGPRMPKV